MHRLACSFILYHPSLGSKCPKEGGTNCLVLRNWLRLLVAVFSSLKVHNHSVSVFRVPGFHVCSSILLRFSLSLILSVSLVSYSGDALFGSIVLFMSTNHDSFVVSYFTRVCVLLELYEILYNTR